MYWLIVPWSSLHVRNFNWHTDNFMCLCSLFKLLFVKLKLHLWENINCTKVMMQICFCFMVICQLKFQCLPFTWQCYELRTAPTDVCSNADFGKGFMKGPSDGWWVDELVVLIWCSHCIPISAHCTTIYLPHLTASLYGVVDISWWYIEEVKLKSNMYFSSLANVVKWRSSQVCWNP